MVETSERAQDLYWASFYMTTEDCFGAPCNPYVVDSCSACALFHNYVAVKGVGVLLKMLLYVSKTR